MRPPPLPGQSSQTPSSSSPEPSVTPGPQAAFDDEERQRINRVQPIVLTAADEHRLEPSLINGVIWVESRFNPRARSSAGARGLMQLMPRTASSLAQKMGRFRAASYDPEFNVQAGTLYLASLRDRYDGDLRLALAAYNAGAGNVDKWMKEDGRLPPRSEEYVRLVLDAQARFESWHRPPAEVPRDTMIAAAETRTIDPSPEPEHVPEPPTRRRLEPRPIVPDAPVRYDLDRVESEYEATPPPEPPVRDTPLPPNTFEPPQPASEGEPQAEPEGPTDVGSPALGSGELPSVLD